MKFALGGLDYVPGVKCVTLDVVSYDADGNAYRQPARFELKDCPELLTLFDRAVAQVGGVIAFAMDKKAVSEPANGVKHPELAVSSGTLKHVDDAKLALVHDEEKRDKEAEKDKVK